MLIIQKPQGLLFEKNIPDVVLQKQNTEASVAVTFKLGAAVVLQENYKFDIDGYITIRRIDEIVSAYLQSQKVTSETHITTTGLVQEFSVDLNSGEMEDVEIPIASSPSSTILQMTFAGTLTDVISVGDKVKSVGLNSYDNVYIQSIDNVSKIVALTNAITFTNGDSVIIEHVVLESFSFSAMHCEADMPAGLNAGTFVAQNFLTRLAREKRTATNQNEYLSYMHFDSYAEVVVKYKAVYDLAGVRTEKTGTFLTIAAQAETGIITFNASLSKIRTIAALPDEYIYQYDIWFTEATTPIDSNVFSFLVVNVYYRNRKYFVFENSFGVLETFMATGRADVKKNVEINLANIQGRYRKTTQDFTVETTLNTGFLSVSEMEWLDDLLLSYNVALYTPGVSGADEEITLTASDKTDTDANELQAFSFSYRRAKNNHLQFTAAARGIFDNTFDQTFN